MNLPPDEVPRESSFAFSSGLIAERLGLSSWTRLAFSRGCDGDDKYILPAPGLTERSGDVRERPNEELFY
jgi:hypothetical protein